MARRVRPAVRRDRSRQATAVGSNREETCHLLVADFPRHSCYTNRGVGCGCRRSMLLGGSGVWRKTPDAPFDFTLGRREEYEYEFARTNGNQRKLTADQ